MKLKYTVLDGTFKRPYADIEVRYGNESVSYVVLVDSGADINLFSAEVGRELGVDIPSGEALTVRGATGDEQTFFMHPVTIAIESAVIETTAAFADIPHLESAGLAGQRGFFNHFHISFEFQASEFELIPRAAPRL